MHIASPHVQYAFAQSLPTSPSPPKRKRKRKRNQKAEIAMRQCQSTIDIGSDVSASPTYRPPPTSATPRAPNRVEASLQPSLAEISVIGMIVTKRYNKTPREHPGRISSSRENIIIQGESRYRSLHLSSRSALSRRVTAKLANQKCASSPRRFSPPVVESSRPVRIAPTNPRNRSSSPPRRGRCTATFMDSSSSPASGSHCSETISLSKRSRRWRGNIRNPSRGGSRGRLA